MNKREWFSPVISLAVSLSVTAVAVADTYVLPSAYDLQTDKNTNTFAVASTAITAYPSDLGEPTFWFDASERTGWEFDATGTGITRIPSKTGTRSLVLDGTGGHWTRWQNGGPVAPKLVDDSALKLGKAVDFGELGSRKGLVFDPWVAGAGCAASNRLINIRTVVAVYGSQNGGGWFMGGGGGGYAWHRAQTSPSGIGNFQWDCPVFQNATADAMELAPFRHDGIPTVPSIVSFSHGWEVVSVVGNGSVDAFGLGVGDTRESNSGRSGGMKIAEFLVFDRSLSTTELERLEAWLQWKWFGRTVRGVNGNTTLGRFRSYGSVANTVDVPAGETLNIDRLEGGNGTSPSFAKTGAGTLRLANAEGYNGTIRLQGGTLDWPGKVAPTAAELPHDLLLHFDASDLNSLSLAEEGGRQYVMCWENQAAGAKLNNKAIRATAPAADRRPWLIPNALGPGLHAVDFSETGDTTKDGRYLRLSTDTFVGDYSETAATIKGVGTVVALVGAQNGGGHIISAGGDAFVRMGGGARFCDGLLNWGTRSDNPKIGVYEGHAALDGSFCCPTDKVVTVGSTTSRFGGYVTPAWHTMSIQTYGGDISLLGARGINYMGGGRYAEVLVWNRTLADDEVLAVQAYLAKKWFGRRNPGYAAPSAPTVPDVQKVSVENATTIAVGGTDSVRIGSLTQSASLVKAGGGTLTVESVTSTDPQALFDIQGGTVRLSGPPDVTAKCAIAAAPALHLDAANTNNMTLIVNGSDIYIDNWTDESGREGAYASQNNRTSRPKLDIVNTCNGLPVVDFGVFGSSQFMTLARSLDSVRHVFVVADLTRGGWLLGSNTGTGDIGNSSNVDFHRGSTPDGGESGYGRPGAQFTHGFSSFVSNGQFYTNGVATTYNMIPADGMQLIEVHPAGGAHLSGLCVDRNGTRGGGPRLAEIVVFERELTARERIATRNALMKKWLGYSDAELADLPDYAPGESTLGTLTQSGGSLQVDAPATAARLAGEGAFTKTGAETLAVKDLTACTGTVTVTAGTLKLPVAAAPASGCGLVTDGRILHLDATTGLTTETAANGTVYVREWASVLNDGWTAYASGMNGVYPSLMTRANGHDPQLPELAADMPAVNMQDNAKQYFLFRKDGVDTQLTGIRSVFWVIGSQLGGGWLMGGGKNTNSSKLHGYPWHRGDSAGTGSGAGNYSSQVLLGGAADASLRQSSWRLNGKAVSPYGAGAAHLSGSWDYLSMTLAGSHVNSPASADGLAFDGRILDPSITDDFHNRDGRQRLGELIIYDRVLSAAEVVSNETYLAAKWGFTQSAFRNQADVILAAGAEIDCGGVYQYLASLSGAGTVTNGTLAVGCIRYDCAADEHVTVKGTFSAPPGAVVELSNLPARATLLGMNATVLEATAFEGVADMSVTFADGETPPNGLGARLRATADGALKLTFFRSGTVLSFR